MKFIGLDLGSTYTKATVICDSGIMYSLSANTPVSRTEGIRYEIDAGEYAKQAEMLLEQLYSSDVEGIVISTQMHGCVLTDDRFNPLTPYISWRDGLGGKWLDTLKAEYGEDAPAAAGVPFKGNLAMSALLGRIREGDRFPEGAYFCTLGGYIIGKLTGNHVCHITNAAPTGMIDVQTGEWNRPLIERIDLSAFRYPEILTGLCPCGQWKGVPVYPDMGDQQVCAAGAGLSVGKTLHINIGTAGLIGILTERFASGSFESRPWLHRGIYLRTVSGLPGGRHLTAFAENIRDMTETITGEKVLMDSIFTYLSGNGQEPCGFGAPWEAMSARGGIVSEYYRSFSSRILEAAGAMQIPVKEIAFSGGCVQKNGALRSRITEAFHVPVVPGCHDVWDGMYAICRELSVTSV